ncbi:condensation domain-containing protein [Micromonospora cathayae]|uniref:Condensation domain-containing protein n=1 Tax=Micromonospora cathayae TaxID=3028804 RepID=A0ABY7ZKI1_9ACTN|nr:condensation domain-containing protein [Micromonospora sp. HUAS 3]WDZ83497.1 condensation domain-containing protein [Micromonospora sp. HUAS 3]
MTVPATQPASDGVAARAPLSFNQEFLSLFDKGDGEGPFGPKYFIVAAWRLRGSLDLDALRAALADVVRRHEILRTEVVRDGENSAQLVRPPSQPQLEVRDLPVPDPADRDARAERLLAEVETEEYGFGELPLLNAVLGRFAADDAALVLIAHHAAADEWSMQLLVRDLANAYATRTGHQVPELPEVRQYREFTVWERERVGTPGADRNREYWRDKLKGARIHTTRTDHPRSAQLPKSTAAHRFLVDADLTRDVLKLSRSLRASPFMVMLAAYKEFLRRDTGRSDLTVPTLSSGRGQARFHQTVGSFFNFVPLRTDVSDCHTFRDVVTATRRTCVQAYSHDLPFGLVLGEAPELMASLAADDQAIFAFQVFQMPFAMKAETVGDVVYSDLRRRLTSQEETTDVPDGALWTFDLDPDGETVGSLLYNTNLLDPARMARMADEYCALLRRLVDAPDAPLDAPADRTPTA